MVDFNNGDVDGRLRLHLPGSEQDLAKLKITLREGMELTFYQDDIETDGVVHFSQEEEIWVGVIDWDAPIRNTPIDLPDPLNE